jgi:hypothetical protein
LARIKRRGEYVFPGVSRSDRSYASAFPKAWGRIVGDAYTPHGLRHAYASTAHELGLSELTIKALLGHARLGVNYARLLRVQINNIQRFLKDPGWQDKVEQLIADIYGLQQFAERELESRPALKGGRPPQHARDKLVARLAIVYQEITGKKAGRSVDPKTGHLKGPFVRFVSIIFRQQHISLAGIRHVIAKAVAKTPL